ncbi:hypothetical protein EK21DRAFT_91751 [Setomelanomma holmii]|uniref:Antifreeze protein n=1 Tax=Setomelanomma holmii TaxID=210430 RepID=A0A9P4H2S2_9PLEO|nr:hypothetical protein EK21DRAFT_91751 [Setomelanomma holmii]
MKFALSTTLFVLASTAAAQSNSSAAPTSTINVTPGCPSAPAADVMVTRSVVAVPSCAAGNSTKPAIVSVSLASGNSSSGSTATGTGSPAQFTGAATRFEGGLMVALGGAMLALVL